METEELLTASECILKYHLDWDVVSRPITVEGKEVPDFQAIQREDTGHTFQVARGRYRPVQNIEAFKFFDEIVKTGQAKYHSAGSYKNGAVVWMRAKLPHDFTVVKGDDLFTYLRLVTSHDGSQRLSIVPEVIRQVCSNGMQALVKDATKRVAVKHTENLRQRFFINADVLLAKEIKYFQTFAAHCQQMAKETMTGIEIDSFLSALFEISDVEDDNSTRVMNQVTEIKRLCDNGLGADLEGVRGTKWGVYNAVTEYIDKYRSTKGKGDNREYSSFLGSGSRLREEAFALLTH